VTTGAASNVGQTFVTLNGLIDPKGKSASAYFEWGTTTNYGSATHAQSMGSGSGPVGLAQELSGLSRDTAYHYRAVGWNSEGLTNGADQAFRTSAGNAACTEDAFTMCLIGGRYKVGSHWQNQYAGGVAATLSRTTLTDAAGGFWLSDSSVFEYLIRINTATDNGHAWISIATFTDVEFWIDVTDTTSGQSYEYHSPPGNRTLIYDPVTFVYPLRGEEPKIGLARTPNRSESSTAGETTGMCFEDTLAMCLIGGRYRVTSQWQNQYAGGIVSDLHKATLADATGTFWLSDSTVFEYLIRINTATNNGRAWIAIPTFTDVEFWITVEDVVGGQSRTYHSPPGNRTLIYDPDFFVYP
jgi:hypothetical protein